MIVNIQLHDRSGGGIFLSHGFNSRRQRPAGLAPDGPKVHQDRALRFKNVSFKRTITGIFHMLTHESGSLFYLTNSNSVRDNRKGFRLWQLQYLFIELDVFSGGG